MLACVAYSVCMPVCVLYPRNICDTTYITYTDTAASIQGQARLLLQMPFVSNSTTHYGRATLKVLPLRKGTGRIRGFMHADTSGTGNCLDPLGSVRFCGPGEMRTGRPPRL